MYNDNNVSIRPAIYTDIPNIADIMIESLPGCLPAKLGKIFITQNFLPKIINNQQTPIYVAEKGKILSSFALFSTPESEIFETLKKIKGPILKHSLQKIIKHPLLVPEIFFSGIINVTRSNVNKKQFKKMNYLVYLATNAKNQSQGLGSLLIAHCLNRENNPLAGTGCLVETDDPRTQKFYLKNNFKEIGWRLRLNTKQILYLREGTTS